MTERGELPGGTRIGRRVRFRSDALVDGLDQEGTPSLAEEGWGEWENAGGSEGEGVRARSCGMGLGVNGEQ